jgi:hypothetical protein
LQRNTNFADGIQYYSLGKSHFCWKTFDVSWDVLVNFKLYGIDSFAPNFYEEELFTVNLHREFLNKCLHVEANEVSNAGRQLGSKNTKLAIHALDQVHCWDAYFRL